MRSRPADRVTHPAARVTHPAARFARLTAAFVHRLPFGLAGVVAPSLVGFVVINSFTFALDLGCLSLLHGGLSWPLALAVTTAYALAFGLSYQLNRVVNFRSHGPVSGELAVYVPVVVVNYLVWVLGVSTGLAAAGLDYRLARIVAGGCEAVYMYVAMRWLVFRRATAR